MQKNTRWQCRIAPSLGDGFAGHPNDVWGTVPYTDPKAPCVFFGMYGMNDFQALWNHQGERAVLWAGSDIRNLLKDYWLDAEGNERVKVTFPEDVRHYVENSIEQIALDSMGIQAYIVPSFLGNIADFTPQNLRTDKKRYYMSVSGGDYKLYGVLDLLDIAHKNQDNEYYLYGWQPPIGWLLPVNFIVRGRVSQETMNEETRTMTGAIRLTRFDGFSEILAKSILWGQKPLSPYIYYPFLDDRNKLLEVVNKYRWNSHV